MTRNVTGQSENEILSREVSDAALERAAALGDAQARITVGVCTDWYTCGWPLSPAEHCAVPRRT
jgi:hypothetical protein